MGMGYGANYADVIEQGPLNSIVDRLVDELVDALEPDWGLEALALDIINEDDSIDEEIKDRAMKIYKKIQRVFKKKTGLTVELNYHDQHDNGDRYDEVNGAFWEVYGMYQLSPAGKKMGKRVPRRLYVTFG